MHGALMNAWDVVKTSCGPPAVAPSAWPTSAIIHSFGYGARIPAHPLLAWARKCLCLKKGITLCPPAPFRAIRHTGRVSLVVLALAAIMVVGGIAVGTFGVSIILKAIREGDMGLTPLC